MLRGRLKSIDFNGYMVKLPIISLRLLLNGFIVPLRSLFYCSMVARGDTL